MNEQQLKLLHTLNQACASPIVQESHDDRLKVHLGEIATLASHLLADLVDVPQIKQQAMQKYALLAADVEKILSEIPTDANRARELAQIGNRADPAQFDGCMAIAQELQQQLHRLGKPEAAEVEKRLVAIEGDYGARVLAAMATRMPQDATAQGAGQTKSFDPRKLNDFIVSAFPAEKGLSVIEANFISGGSSKYTMAIRLGGVRELPQEIILRGDSASSAGFGGATVLDEYRLLKVMYEHGVCVAKPLALESSGEVFGTPFMLVERRPGKMVGHMFNLPKPNRITNRDTAEKLAAIHRVPIASIGEWIRGANVSTSTQIAATLAESYANWAQLERPSPIYEAAFKWLRDNVSVMDRSRGLVHGDYGLNNLLIDDSKVSVILDWEFSHIANPAYDLGYFYYQAESLGSWEEFLDAYRKAGAEVPSTEELDYSILFAATRLGVMLCQAEAAFRSGVTDGLFISLAIGRNCHSISLTRLSRLLERLL